MYLGEYKPKILNNTSSQNSSMRAFSFKGALIYFDKERKHDLRLKISETNENKLTNNTF